MRPVVDVRRALEKITRADAALRGKKIHVHILGAGVAGLAAALELTALGHTVTILEGSKKVGGRVSTKRWGETYSERGAMRVPTTHDYTAWYARKMGLWERRLLFSNQDQRFDIQGTVSWSPDELRRRVHSWPGLTEQERGLVRSPGGLGALMGHLMGPVMGRLIVRGELTALGVAIRAGDFASHAELRALDAMSWLDYLRSQKASEGALDLLGRVLSLAVVWHWSLATILRDELHQAGQGTPWALDGGMDQIPRAMELALKLHSVDVKFEQKVSGISLNEDGTGTLAVEGLGEVPFQHLLCTLPFPVMRPAQRFLRGFPEAKQAAVDGLVYCSALKVLFKYEAAWWRDLSGRSVSDKARDGSFTDPSAAALRQCYYPSSRKYEEQPAMAAAENDGGLFRLYTGEMPDHDALMAAAPAEDPTDATTRTALLAAYTLNKAARSVSDDDAVAAAQIAPLLGALHPGAPAHTEAEIVRWDQNPWSKGAMALTTPGLLSSFFADACARSGRVHFVGEHVSSAPGWIQGALESSLREVAAMLELARG